MLSKLLYKHYGQKVVILIDEYLSLIHISVMMDEDLTIHRNVVPHLDVLTAGEVVEYPSDIVDSSKLPAIFEYVRDEYDVVIIDTPPVLSVTDAVVLAEKSDGVVLVVKNEVASPKDLIEAKKRLSQVGISLLG